MKPVKYAPGKGMEIRRRYLDFINEEKRYKLVKDDEKIILGRIEMKFW